MKEPNVVQVEFFLPYTAKQAFRFFDTDEALTLLSLRIEMREALRHYYLYLFEMAIQKKSWLRNWFQKRYLRALLKNSSNGLLQLHEKKIELSLARTIKAIQSGSAVIEQRNGTFRPIHKGEIPRWIKLLKETQGVWVFVFRHNDLRAQKNVAVASAM